MTIIPAVHQVYMAAEKLKYFIMKKAYSKLCCRGSSGTDTATAPPGRSRLSEGASLLLSKRMKQNFLLLLILLLGGSAKAQTLSVYGTGIDRAPTGGIPGFVDDVRAHVTVITPGTPYDDLAITGGAGTFASNDYVIIIDMFPLTNTSRNYYIREINGVTPGHITVPHMGTTLSGGYVQVVKIHQYSNATVNGTVTCHPWDWVDKTGGVICFMDNGTLTIGSTGKIDGSGTMTAPTPGVGGGPGSAGGSGGAAGTGSHGNGGNATSSPSGAPATYGNSGYCYETTGGTIGCDWTDACGGTGGNGTAPMLGPSGTTATALTTVFDDDNTIPLLTPGQAGKSTDGANGPGAGGNGGGGGSSDGTATPVCTGGTAGSSPTGSGGNGALGGGGGAVIYILADDISVPSPHFWLYNDGGNGATGGSSTANGGNGGSGGNGEHYACTGSGTWIDAGGAGATGIGGNGGCGADGADGGGPGSIWITTSVSTLPTGISQADGTGGNPGSGVSGGSNGTAGTDGDNIPSYTSCCTGTGGTGGGGTGTPPSESRTLLPQNIEYDCECYQVFAAIKRLWSSGSGTSGGSAWTLGPLSSGDLPGRSNSEITVNLTTGLATYEFDLSVFQGSYSGSDHVKYTCYEVTTNLSSMMSDINTSNSITSGYSVSDVDAWPRTVALSGAGWTYHEKNPIQRWSQNGSSVVNMNNCSYYETSRTSAIPGWGGSPGNSATDSRSVQHNVVQSGFVSQDNLAPELINKIADVKVSDPSLLVHPNPANDQLIVSYSQLRPGTYMLRLFDATGHIVFSKSIQVTSASGQYNLSVAQYSAGSYSLRLNNEDMSIEQKIVIQH